MTPELADKLNGIIIVVSFLISFGFTILVLMNVNIQDKLDKLEDKVDKLYTLIKDKR